MFTANKIQENIQPTIEPIQKFIEYVVYTAEISLQPCQFRVAKLYLKGCIYYGRKRNHEHRGC